MRKMVAALSGLIEFYSKVIQRLSVEWEYLVGTFRRPGTKRVASEFFAEVAVLVAVFPILDTIVESRFRDLSASNRVMAREGPFGLSWPLIVLSYSIVLICFLIAIVLSAKEEDDREGEE